MHHQNRVCQMRRPTHLRDLAKGGYRAGSRLRTIFRCWEGSWFLAFGFVLHEARINPSLLLGPLPWKGPDRHCKPLPSKATVLCLLVLVEVEPEGVVHLLVIDLELLGAPSFPMKGTISASSFATTSSITPLKAPHCWRHCGTPYHVPTSHRPLR